MSELSPVLWQPRTLPPGWHVVSVQAEHNQMLWGNGRRDTRPQGDPWVEMDVTLVYMHRIRPTEVTLHIDSRKFPGLDELEAWLGALLPLLEEPPVHGLYVKR